MFAFLQYVLALVSLAYASAPGVASPTVDLTGITITLVAFPLAVRVLAVLVAHRNSPDDPRSLFRALAASTACRIWALILFHVIAERLGGANAGAALGVGTWVLVPKLLGLLPFFVLIAGFAWGFQPALAALRVGARTPLAAVADEFKQGLLPIATILPLVLFQDVTEHLSPLSAAGRAYGIIRFSPALQALVTLGVALAGLLAFPFVLRLCLRAKPLPDGALRRRLEAYARRVGLGYRDILVWRTGRETLNAAVVGVFPWFRYVLVTDGLLETLGEDEIEAVFAHEAGHAKRGHILLFFGFTAVLGLVGMVPALAGFVFAVLAPLPPALQSAVVLLVWLGVVFGWVSRRFEQEADVYGIETLPLAPGDTDSSHHPFGRALARIGSEVGAIREMTGWRHFSIADRVKFVHEYVTDSEVRRRYRTSIVLLRTTLLVVIGGFGLATAVRLKDEIPAAVASWRTGTPVIPQDGAPEGNLLLALHSGLTAPDARSQAFSFLFAAGNAVQARRTDDALRWMREAAARSDGEPAILVLYAEQLEMHDRPLGAKLLWEELAAREGLDPELRNRAAEKAARLGSR